MDEQQRKRHAHYCEYVMDNICAHLADGLTLKQACKKAGKLAPNSKTVWKWRQESPALEEKYQRALDAGARKKAEEREMQKMKMVQRIVKVETMPIADKPICAAQHWASALFTGV
jgi:hypothetical protein